MSRSDPPQSSLDASDSDGFSLAYASSAAASPMPICSPSTSLGRMREFVGGCIASLVPESMRHTRQRSGDNDVGSPASVARKRTLYEGAIMPSSARRVVVEPPPVYAALGQMLRDEAPEVVYAYIGRFIGGKTIMSSLGTTCKGWRSLLESSSLLWWFLCGDTGKLTVLKRFHNRPAAWGNDNFFELYKSVPAFPIDYSSIQSAVNCVDDNGVVVVLPGRHMLASPIVFDRNKRVNIVGVSCADAELQNGAIADTSALTSPVLYYDVDAPMQESMEVDGDVGLVAHSARGPGVLTNQPIFLILNGTVAIHNLHLRHHCHGRDIWNGNAAVQVNAKSDAKTLAYGLLGGTITPKVFIYDCKIRSSSGRGAVCIKGEIILDNTTVAECAATGIYIGGKSSRASISNCEIFHNGLGGPTENRDPGEIVLPGHSGLYVEQGCVAVNYCSISKNTFTGISSCSPLNSTLIVRNSSIIGNEGGGIELPPYASESHRRSQVCETLIVESDQEDHFSRSKLVQERIEREIARERMIGGDHEAGDDWLDGMLRGGDQAPFRDS